MRQRLTAHIVLGIAGVCTAAAVALPPLAPPKSDKLIITRAEPAKRSLARMDFARAYHDFGSMMDNEVHETEFEFTNTGSEAL